MCLGNRAAGSSRYINSQFRAQWDNAKACAEIYVKGRKPDDAAIERGTCLREFYGPPATKRGRSQAKDDPLCHFLFDTPHLEFVCNHEVVLFFELISGRFVLKSSAKHTQRSSTVEHFEQCITVALRLNFNTHSVDNFACDNIGNNSSYTIALHVLDLDSATLVPQLSSFPQFIDINDEKDSYEDNRKVKHLTHYITQYYLPIFKRGGFHVLYSLPDFDDLVSTTSHIDYSIISKRALSVEKLHGIEIEAINEHLRGSWLQSATHIDSHETATDNESMGKQLLAEHNTQWNNTVEDMHMRMYFGPLQIRALCTREVILFMDFQDLEVDMHFSSAHYAIKGWKLAFVVDVIYEETSDIRRLKLDVNTARFCERLSEISNQVDDEELSTHIRATLVKYVIKHYFVLLEMYEWASIYEAGPEQPADSDSELDEDEEEKWTGCVCSTSEACTHRGGMTWGVWKHQLVTHTDMHGFDTVMAVTQHNINLHLKSLHAHAQQRCSALRGRQTWSSQEMETETALAEWSFVHPEHGDAVFFRAAFDTPKIQLDCHEGSRKVMFFLSLRDGFLRPLNRDRQLQPEAEKQALSRWRLAFEVNLELKDVLEQSVPGTILNRLAGRRCSFKQLVMNLSTARFSMKHSAMPGLLDGDIKQVRTRREALLYYITAHYLAVLKRAGYSTLYTIPLAGDRQSSYSGVLSAVKFQMLPFQHRSEISFSHQGLIHDRNSVVFLGMTDGRPMPQGELPRGVNWVCGSKDQSPLGAICITRRAFLDSKLLTLLEGINRNTTVVPLFSGVHDGEWFLTLTTWEKHRHLSNWPCSWKQRSPDGDSLSFEWNNRDEWRYEHEGDSNGCGLYSVKSVTNNSMSVPTVRRNSQSPCPIKLSGKVDLTMEYVGSGADSNKRWNTLITVRWSASIMLHGTTVSVSPAEIVPLVQFARYPNELGKSICGKTFASLQDEFPATIDFSQIVTDLNDSLKLFSENLHSSSRELGLANPIFNRHGDLFLELASRDMQLRVNGNGSVMGGRGVYDGTPLTSPASVIMAVTSPFSPKTTLKRSEVRVEYTKVQQQSVSAREFSRVGNGSVYGPNARSPLSPENSAMASLPQSPSIRSEYEYSDNELQLN